MLPARSSQLAYCYLHEGMLFCYFPLTDTEIETGKHSNHNISCRGRRGKRYLHGITPRTYPEHTEIIILTDRENISPFKASGHVCWAHNVAWLSWPLAESGPTARVRGTLPLGMQSHLFHNRNIRKVGGKDSGLEPLRTYSREAAHT